MPTVQKRDPVAICCSDLHLTLKQPPCRADKDWMAAQQEYLDQVTQLSFSLAEKSPSYGGKYLPVIIAGDIFDRWNPPPELLSFAFRHLPPKVFSVAGQHDLPNHRMEDMHKSGYGVLVEAERIMDLGRIVEVPYQRYSLHGFGWNRELAPPDPSFDKIDPMEGDHIKIAVVHKYVWMSSSNAFPSAPKEAHLRHTMSQLKGFDIVIFGDNHKGFHVKSDSGVIAFNCGGFIRRKSDEMFYRPMVGIIYADGSVKPKALDTSIDVFHENAARRELEEKIDENNNAAAFLQELEGLGEHGMNFRDQVVAYCRKNKVPKSFVSLILDCLNG